MLLTAVLMPAGCKEEVTAPLIGQLQLSMEFVGVTESFVRVKATVNDIPWILLVTRDSTTVFMSQVLDRPSIDTLIHDRYLRPGRDYVYRAYYLFNLTEVDSSAPLSVGTIEASSNDFTWQLYELGDGYAGGYRDVAIINDTCVWVVGEIYKFDSTHTLLTMFNAARWDGAGWSIYRVPVRLQYIDTALITDQEALFSVLAPAENDVWFVSVHGGVTRYEDSSWNMMRIPYDQGPGTASRIWGTNSSDLYFGAMGGRLTHFDGTVWRQLSSHTSLWIQDIWGATDNVTGNQEILAVASSPSQTLDREILKIAGETVLPYADLGIHSALLGVWFVPGKKYFTVGDSIFTKGYPVTDSSSWSLDNPYPYLQNCVRGNGLNDAVIAGGMGEIVHFDGLGWHSFFYYTHLTSGNYYRVAMRGNLIVAVGDNGGRGAIAVGLR